ncbi:MAG TPA: hypothetical protein VGM02_01625 [Acidobacteriaceae bacterium]|jgi:RecB family exonuclease
MLIIIFLTALALGCIAARWYLATARAKRAEADAAFWESQAERWRDDATLWREEALSQLSTGGVTVIRINALADRMDKVATKLNAATRVAK